MFKHSDNSGMIYKVVRGLSPTLPVDALNDQHQEHIVASGVLSAHGMLAMSKDRSHKTHQLLGVFAYFWMLHHEDTKAKATGRPDLKLHDACTTLRTQYGMLGGP